MARIELPEEAVYKGYLVLVNANNACRQKSERSLVSFGENGVLLERQTASILDRCLSELGAAGGIVGVSGWRSSAEQEKIYSDSLAENGGDFTRKFVALPGHSEHQTGLAVDLAENRPNIDFIRPEFPYEGICRSFREAAPSFGFIERYPKGRESITGIAWEPWHFRYVGYPHAEIIEKNGLTLEEYHEFIKQYPYGKKHYVFSTGSGRIDISYLPAKKGGPTYLDTDGERHRIVSGNNSDGFIVTQWR